MSFPLAHGSVPPMITPMTEDAASVDHDGIAALVEWHIEAGTTGLFVVCSTGRRSDDPLAHLRTPQMAVDLSPDACAGGQVSRHWAALWDGGLHGRPVAPDGHSRRGQGAVRSDASRSGAIAFGIGVWIDRSVRYGQQRLPKPIPQAVRHVPGR